MTIVYDNLIITWLPLPYTLRAAAIHTARRCHAHCASLPFTLRAAAMHTAHRCNSHCAPLPCTLLIAAIHTARRCHSRCAPHTARRWNAHCAPLPCTLCAAVIHAARRCHAHCAPLPCTLRAAATHTARGAHAIDVQQDVHTAKHRVFISDHIKRVLGSKHMLVYYFIIIEHRELTLSETVSAGHSIVVMVWGNICLRKSRSTFVYIYIILISK